MTESIDYWYYKKSDLRESEAITILREQKENTFAVEYWAMDHWENGIDFWWQLRQETCYHDIEEDEALKEIKKLSIGYKEAKKRKQKEDTEKLRLKKLADRRKDEVFTSLMDGGFSENQAIQIVSTVLATFKNR